MIESAQSTQQSILQAGKKEFLAKGFQAASLRNIAKEAGVTTGAFYGYYKSKEELFDALVAQPYQTMMAQYIKAQQTFAALPPKEQLLSMGDISGECMNWIVEYMYEQQDAFKLLLCCAEGTRYEQFIHQMAEIEVTYTHQFMNVLSQLGQPVREIDSQLEHILISGMFAAFFEIIIHDMPKEQATKYIKELREFYTAGWMKVMGL